MKEHHRMAALMAANLRHPTHVLPNEVHSVGAVHGTPVIRDRATGRVINVYSPYAEHIELQGRACVGGVLSPARPKHRGATPLRGRRTIKKIKSFFRGMFHVRNADRPVRGGRWRLQWPH